MPGERSMTDPRFDSAGSGPYAAIVRHGTLVAVVALLLAVLGVLAVLRIPVQMIPDLEVRTITVQTRWAGATPQDMEKDILLAQEEVLRALPGLRRMTASAGTGSASIALEFPFDVDLTEALIRVNNALSRVSDYPENVSQPRIVAASFSANAFMFYRVSPLPGNPRQIELTLMRDFLEDNVRPRMESVPGVSEVTVGGGAERQIQLWLDPEALAAVGLTVADVRAALRARNRDVSGGVLEEGKRRYLLRTVGRFDSLDELEQLILLRRGDSLVRLGEVARGGRAPRPGLADQPRRRRAGAGPAGAARERLQRHRDQAGDDGRGRAHQRRAAAARRAGDGADV
jgi:multidrug efflux pump subunit AcrB